MRFRIFKVWDAFSMQKASANLCSRSLRYETFSDSNGLEVADSFSAASRADGSQRVERNVFAEETDRSVTHQNHRATLMERVDFTVVDDVNEVRRTDEALRTIELASWNRR